MLNNILWREKQSLAGQSFIGSAFGSPGAGEAGYGQIFNPAASGVTLIVSRISTSSNQNGTLKLNKHNAAVGADGSKSTKKISSGAAPAADINAGSTAVSIGTTIATSPYLLASSVYEFILDEPIILEPGNGVHVEAAAGDQAIRVLYEWKER